MSKRESMWGVNWERWVPRSAFVVFSSILTLWFGRVIVSGFECTLGADWVMFHDTARLALSGRWVEIYPGITKGYPFFYPPYFVTFVAPLGLVSRPWAYALIVLAMAGATAVSFRMLRLMLPAKTPSYETGILVALSSASGILMFVSGQLSATYLLVLTLGLLLWCRELRPAAGAVLGLLMLKPNLGLIFPLIFVARRRWALLAGWAVGFFLLAATTYPMGARIWVDYLGSFRTLGDVVSGQIPMWKQQTIYAFWRTALGTTNGPMVLVLWALSVLPLGAGAAAAWLVSPLDARRLPRLFGITVLALACGNPYFFTYDGLLLALPGLVWYMQWDGYRSATCHRVGGAALLFVYAWQHLATWVLHGDWALVGPAVGVWLIAEVWDLIGARHGLATATSARPDDRGNFIEQESLGGVETLSARSESRTRAHGLSY